MSKQPARPRYLLAAVLIHDTVFEGGTKKLFCHNKVSLVSYISFDHHHHHHHHHHQQHKKQKMISDYMLSHWRFSNMRFVQCVLNLCFNSVPLIWSTLPGGGAAGHMPGARCGVYGGYPSKLRFFIGEMIITGWWFGCHFLFSHIKRE